MADLYSLIRLHQHELDEKRRTLGELYAQVALLERKRRDLDRQLEHEKKSIDIEGGVHFTFANYVAQVQKQQKDIDRAEEALEEQIELAKEDMMDTFGELKKFEKTQEARDAAEAEARQVKESQELDAIGIETYRRSQEEERR